MITLTIVALAWVTIRAMKSFQRLAGEMETTSKTVQQVTQQVQAITTSVRAMSDALRDSVSRLQRTAGRFGDLKQRSTHLTNGSLEDVRETARRVTATMRIARELSGRVFRKVAATNPIRSNGG